jgi:PP-loop superfamily ATP-utilizing enzyme
MNQIKTNTKNTGNKKTKRKSKTKKRALVLFSGGLDSRLV